MGRPGTALLEALDLDWRLLSSSRAGEEALRRWRRVPALRRLGSLDDVLARTRRGADRERADKVLAALIALAPSDRLATRAVLQALLPGLTNVGKRMRLLRDEEHTAELLTVAIERIRTYRVEDRPRAIAANVVLDVLHVFSVRARVRPVAREVAADPGDFDGLATRSPDPPDPDPREVIARARARGRVSDEELAIVEEAVVEQVPHGVAARVAGVSEATVRQRRSRARRQLALACAGA